MSLVVTGATGHLGRLTVEALLARGVAPDAITATGRDATKLAALAELGVQTAVASFDDPDSLAKAFAGAERVLLVSGNEFGQRVTQHGNAIDAAKAAGVALLAYTSAPYASTTSMLLATEHRATEELILASGVPYALLRNGWYIENYTGQLATTLEHGMVGSAGDGRLSVAARSDYAEAAAVVLSTDGHEHATYELGGDIGVSLADIAGAIAAASGQAVPYIDVTPEAHLQVLLGAGLPQPMAEVFVDVDRAIAAGELLVTSGDLARLIGHEATPLSAGIERDVAAFQAAA